MFFPPGLYRCTDTLKIGHNTQIVGAGQGASRLQFTVAGDTSGLARHPDLTGEWQNFVLRDITIGSTDGIGGCGVELVSASGALLDNVQIDRFRSSLGDGCGLRILNSPEGSCWRNRLDHVYISNCDTGLLMDGLFPQHSCGYMNFTGLTIHQERDCVVLKRSAENASINNRFFGLTIQGTSNVGGLFLVIEGHSNHFDSLVIDGAATSERPHIWFRTNVDSDIIPASNRVSGGSYDFNAVKDDNISGTGGFNTFDHPAFFGGGGQHPWVLNGQSVAGPV